MSRRSPQRHPDRSVTERHGHVDNKSRGMGGSVRPGGNLHDRYLVRDQYRAPDRCQRRPVDRLRAAAPRRHLVGFLAASRRPALIVVFALAIVVLAGATARLAGWMTLFGAAALMTVSLIEITGYIGTLQTSPATMFGTSLALIHSVQHLWFIVAAPALWLPLGLVICGSAVLPRILGYLAIVLAAGYALAGVVTLFDLTVPAAVQIAAGVVPALWWLAAAGTLLIRARQAPPTAGLPSGVAAAGQATAGRL